MENLGKLFAYVLERQKSDNFFKVRGAANNLFIGSRAIADAEVLNSIERCLTDYAIVGWRSRNWLDEFENYYSTWLSNSKNNTINGLNNFKPSFSTGTTQSFDSFYIRHRQKKFKCLVGEYFYHLKSWISNDFDWAFVNDINDLEHGDALVISNPFCDTGNTPPQFDELLNRCESKNIPVLIDSCYYSIASGVDLNLNYDCIDTVTFGLSKTFPVANLRIGIRYTKPSIRDGQTLHSDINYNHSLSACIGLELMKAYSADFVYDKYCNKHVEACRDLGLAPSQTVMFASGGVSWSTYNRTTMLREYQLNLDPVLFNNRICLNSFYENWDLYNKFRNYHENNTALL
jgi:hypothetical protein